MEHEFTVELCKDKGGYAAKPVEKLSLDLDAISNSFETIIKTPILIVIKINNHEVICHNFGELIFKNLTDKKQIRNLANNIYNKSLQVIQNA